MTKKELRIKIKNLIKGKTSDELKQASEEICRNILNSKEYKESDYILAYMALEDEVSLKNLIEKALTDGKQVFIPRIITAEDIEFYKYKPYSKLTQDHYNILEPKDSEEILDLCKLPENTLILVPGRAFSRDLYRLGRGKGFYDRYLQRIFEKKNACNKICIAGIAFTFQVLENIPKEIHDKKMNIIFTQ